MTSTDHRLDELERRNAELTTELHSLRSLLERNQQKTSAPPTADQTVSRRHALRTAGAVAAGALATTVAVTITSAAPAAAAPLGPVDGNPAITATASPGDGTAISAISASGRAIDAQTTSGTGLNGGANSGIGVAGTSASGTAVSAISLTSIGVRGVSNSDIGGSFTGGPYGLRANGTTSNLLLVPSGASPLSTTTTYEQGAMHADQFGNLWYCTTAGTPGEWRQLAGTNTAGSYHPLTPGRVYDSRAQWPFTGRLNTGQRRTVFTGDKRDQNGNVTTANFVPAGAQAVMANITVVETAYSGWLAANPGGTNTVSASTINWSDNGQILANGIALTLNPTNRNLTVIAGGPGSTDFLIDIFGYWL